MESNIINPNQVINSNQEINYNPVINQTSTRKWQKEEEYILKEWADQGLCFKWLHLKSYEYYQVINAVYVVPVIILSTITGTANFAQGRVPPSYLNLYVMVVGSLNLLAGIISTIHQYLKIAEINEGHRVAYIAWDKFSRNIKIELAKNPDDRIGVVQMLKMCKEEYDRLEETSPPIETRVINKFKATFGEIQGLVKPDILGKLTPISIFDRDEHQEEKESNEIKRIIKENTRLQLEAKQMKNNSFLDNTRINFLQSKGRLPNADEMIELGSIV